MKVNVVITMIDPNDELKIGMVSIDEKDEMILIDSVDLPEEIVPENCGGIFDNYNALDQHQNRGIP